MYRGLILPRLDAGITQTDHLRLFSGQDNTLWSTFVAKVEGLGPLVRAQLTCAVVPWLQKHTFAPLEVTPSENMSECLNGFFNGLGDSSQVVDFV